MATHYIELKNGTTAKEIKAKFAAFELLYGKSEMLVRGNLNELYKGRLQPMFLQAPAKVTKITPTKLHILTREEGAAVVSLGNVTIGIGRDVYQPELMFITVV